MLIVDSTFIVKVLIHFIKALPPPPLTNFELTFDIISVNHLAILNMSNVVMEKYS